MAAGKPSYYGPQELRGGLRVLIRSSGVEFAKPWTSENEASMWNTRGLQNVLQKEGLNREGDEGAEFQVQVSCNDDLQYRVQDQIALVELVNVSAVRKDLNEGARLHASALRVGLLELNVFVGSALVNMYAKCAALEKAQLVLDDLPLWNAISWNGLIAGYVQHGLGEKALSCYDRMQQDGLLPDEVTFSCILKACGSILACKKGQEIHVELIKRGLLEQDVVLGNALVDLYCKCGALVEAHQIFEELPVQNVVSWTTLITGYCHHGHFEEAVCCFEQMKQEDLSPDAMTFSCILSACGSAGLLEKGREVHAEVIRFGSSEIGLVLGNSLVDMYAKCGALARAELVFEELPIRDVVSWNVLIGGYCGHGLGQDALRCFESMSHNSISPDEVTFACILKACSSIRAADTGGKIHSEIMRQGFLKKDSKLGNALVDMYAKCGVLAKAQQVFKELQVRDAVSWTSLITGLCLFGHGEDACNYFREFRKTGLLLDIVALAGILKACGSIWASDMGKELHAEVVKRGLLGVEVVIGITLVDMYAKCGMLAKAQQVLNELPMRTVMSWNALIAGYCQQGHEDRTLACYELMKFEGIMPDAASFSLMLKACGSIGAADKGQEFHAEIARQGLLEKNDVLGNALLDMYTKCGLPLVAKQVFDELPCRNIVSWNVLIVSCCQYDHSEEAIGYFDTMKHEGLSPDAGTFASILKACGGIGAAEKGQEIHVDLVLRGFLATDPVVGSALVDMYSKCGALMTAREVFDKLPTQDVVSWTVLIGGYCEHGHAEEALESFKQMRHAGLSPDAATFACILKACGSIGAADKGQMLFDSISRRYGIFPTLEHHTSIVDLHGRAGHFDEAISLIKKMPSSVRLPVWLAFLGACQKWGNVKLGELAFEHMVREPHVD